MTALDCYLFAPEALATLHRFFSVVGHVLALE
jgi:hypothetical protein